MAGERLAEDLLSLARLLRPLRRAEMTPQQYWLLRHLRRQGPSSIGEVATALGITTGSATMACKRLEKSGLVRRERQSQDERVVQVALTEAGLAQIERWRHEKQLAVAKLLDAFTPAEQQQLQDLVERLLEEAQRQGFEL